MNEELKGYLLGNASSNLWTAALIAAFFTALMMFTYRVSKRNKESPRTPVKFSLIFFFKDTGLRIIYTIGFTLILIRLMFIWELEVEWAIGFSIFFGIVSDRIGKFFTKAGDKGEEVINEKIDELADNFKKQESNINTVKSDVKEIKSDVKDIKNDG